MVKKKTNPKAGHGDFRLEVPLDASGIENFKPDQKVKVMLVDSKGKTNSTLVRMDKRGKGEAVFNFKKSPGQLKVIIGPANASDEEMQGLQTLTANVSSRCWLEAKKFKLKPICIHYYHWHWWYRWCRTFTITGKVVCPDGNPVPGAKVCAYDRDSLWWWTSEQQVGCDTTNFDGAFEIKFKWCCGWWPWWWWRHRHWRFDSHIYEIIKPILEYDPPRTRIRFPISLIDPVPDLRVFEDILGDDLIDDFGIDFEGRIPERRLFAKDTKNLISSDLDIMSSKRADTSFNLEVLPKLRERLLDKLSHSHELARLCIWPWYHWYPWLDCTPDIVFKVTQECQDEEHVIVNEGIDDIRWNIPTTLDNVILQANEDACCIGGDDDDPSGSCLRIDDACNLHITSIGGNEGALASPIGYQNPGLATNKGDRPFAGNIPIHGVFGSTAEADYYEIEYTTTPNIPSSWASLPSGACGGFTRRFYGAAIGASIIDPSTWGWHNVSFSFNEIDGHYVIESRDHFEKENDLLSWLAGWRGWWEYSRNLLIILRTNGYINDGTQYFRVRSWKKSGTSLIDDKILPYCLTNNDNQIALTIDNRIVTNSTHDPYGQVCGAGTVHTCTTEPATGFTSVKIIRSGQPVTEIEVGACTQAQITLPMAEESSPDMLQIDFYAHDLKGHLSYFTLNVTYGDNLINNLLGFLNGPNPKAKLTPLAIPDETGAADFAAKDYQHALSLPTPATSPIWKGGGFRLTIPAHLAFPETCCYQLELRAHKRTIVDCNTNLWGHTNYSERSFMIETTEPITEPIFDDV